MDIKEKGCITQELTQWSKIKNGTWFPPLFLLLVVLFCLSILAVVNFFTKEPKAINLEKDENIGIARLLGMDGIEDSSQDIDNAKVANYVKGKIDIDSWKIGIDHRFVKAVSKLNNDSSYILKLQGSGYGGAIFILAFYSDNGALKDAIVVDHSETSGVGSIIQDDDYMERYLAHGDPLDIPSSKRNVDAQYLDSITGATVSFRAVAKALQQGADYIKAFKKKGSLNIMENEKNEK